MVDFDERNLVALAQRAGFEEVRVAPTAQETDRLRAHPQALVEQGHGGHRIRVCYLSAPRLGPDDELRNHLTAAENHKSPKAAQLQPDSMTAAYYRLGAVLFAGSAIARKRCGTAESGHYRDTCQVFPSDSRRGHVAASRHSFRRTRAFTLSLPYSPPNCPRDSIA